VPGLLSFREAPTLIKVLASLHTSPDVLMVDGQGIAHPRRMGIAAHIGLFVDIPTIGVRKSRLCGEERDPGPNAGDSAPLVHKEEIIGTILRTKPRSKPLYISPGNHCDLQSACEATDYQSPQDSHMTM